MNRSRLLIPTVLVVGLALTVSALAQDRGRGGRGFRGGFGGTRSIDKTTLIGSTQVREELKITEEQGKKIDEILAAHRDEARGLFSFDRFRDASDEEREKLREEFGKKSAELRKKSEGKLDAALEKEQIRRLDEIVLQQQGVDALISEPVAASLKLDKEQVEKIKAAFASRDEELGKLRGGRGRGRGRGDGDRGGRGDFEATREKMEKLRETTEKAVLAVLTKEQGESFAKLKGKPFELDRRSLFRGRGRFGGGEGRGGRGGRDGGGRERRRPDPDDEV